MSCPEGDPSTLLRPSAPAAARAPPRAERWAVGAGTLSQQLGGERGKTYGIRWGDRTSRRHWWCPGAPAAEEASGSAGWDLGGGGRAGLGGRFLGLTGPGEQSDSRRQEPGPEGLLGGSSASVLRWQAADPVEQGLTS